MFRKRVDAETEPAPAATASSTVVVVGDNPDAAEVLARLLASAGHHITKADRLDTLMQAVQSHRPSIVVVDLARTTLDEADALRGAIGSVPDPPPILLLAGPAVSDEVVGALAPGHTLRKPVAAHEITAAVTRFARH